GRSDGDRFAVDIGRDRAVRGADTVEGGPDAVVDGAANEAAVVDHRRLRRGVDLARELAESRPRLRGGKVRHGIVDRIAEAEAFDPAACGDLVGRDADGFEVYIVTGHRQPDIAGVIAERGREEGQIGSHAGEGAVGR